MTNHRKPNQNPGESYWGPAMLMVLAVLITVWVTLGNEGVSRLLNLMFG